MVGLRELAEEAKARTPRCKVGRYLDSLTGDDYAWLSEALAGHTNARSIAVTLTRAGMPISDTTVGRHKRGYCMCALDAA